jgi:acyl-CoA thioesterase I
MHDTVATEKAETPRRRVARGYGRRHALVNASTLAAAALTAPSAWAQSGRPRLLLLGDSLTAGYGIGQAEAFPARLQAALVKAGIDAEVINAGVSGDTSAGGLARLDWAIGDRPPSHAIVALGANDGLRGLPPTQMQANLDQILQRLRARGTKILLAGMLAPPNLGREYADAFAEVFRTLAAKHSVALYPFFLDGVAAVPRLNQQDGIHPNPAGVEVLVERILPQVRQLLAS